MAGNTASIPCAATNPVVSVHDRKERAPRPPKTLEEKPAVFVEQSRFSALAEDEDA